jgi:hypothetical protein
MEVPSPDEFLSVEIGGLKITEPTTAGTDVVIAIIAFVISAAIFKHIRDHKSRLFPSDRYWLYFFLFLGLSTLAGALSHGLRYYLPASSFVAIFTTMNVLSMISSYNAQLATIEFEIERPSPWMKVTALSLMIIFILLVSFFQKFAITNVYVSCTFLFVLYHHWRSWKKGKQSSKYICFGIMISFITAFVFLLKLSVSEWFNHKDIAHVLIMISLIVMYKGAREIYHR